MKLEELRNLSKEELIERFPFIVIRDCETGEPFRDSETGEVCIELDHTWGWHDLELLICEHIKKEYDTWDEETKKNFSILQVKEKFGGLRFYCSRETEKIRLATDWAENISFYTCIKCGKKEEISPGRFRVYLTKGWVCPYCKDCAEELLYIGHPEYRQPEYKYWPKSEEKKEAIEARFTIDEYDAKYEVTHYSQDGKTIEERDSNDLYNV